MATEEKLFDVVEKIKKDNPDLSREFIEGILEALEEKKWKA